MQYVFKNSYTMGILFVVVISIISVGASFIPAVYALHISPLIIGVILGSLLSFVYHRDYTRYNGGVTFSAKKILHLGIILYGFNVSLSEISQVGIIGVLACIFVVAIILAFGVFIGVKFLKLDKDIAILVSGGSAICGAAAILALESSLRSEPYKGVIAVGTVVIFGLIGMFAYPIVYASGLIPLNHIQEGLYIGLTLHEVANVVGAGSAISPECANFALISKMIRVILLIPVLLIIPFLVSHSDGGAKRHLHIPWFAFWFLGVVVFHSFVYIPEAFVDILKFLSAFCLTMAMSALGLQIDLRKFKSSGGGAFILALILFIILCAGGFLLVMSIS